MLEFQYKAIGAQKKTTRKIDIQKATTQLRYFGDAAITYMRHYPAKNSKTYKRKNEQGLKGGWDKRGPNLRGGNLFVEVFNNVDYAVWVQGSRRSAGPRQRTLFARKGWRSITDLNTKVWPRFKPKIAAALGIPIRNVSITRQEFEE